jgi:hypothetical protein
MVDFRRGSATRQAPDRPETARADSGPGVDGVPCTRCGTPAPRDDLDRLLWCPECRVHARRRAERQGWWFGAALAGLLVLYLVLVVRPAPDLILGGWLACVLAAFYIGARVAREIGYGIQRIRSGPATGSVPTSRGPTDPTSSS